MKLRLVAKFEITPKDPFNFDFSFYKPDHFPTPDTEWVNGNRWQTMLWKGRKLGLVFEDRSKEKFPAVLVKVFHVTGLHKKFLSDLKEEIVWRFNLNLNLLDFYRFAQKDHLLRHVIQKLWGLRPMNPVSLYEYLVISIVLQNATVRRSVYMVRALFEKYGTLLE